MKKSSEFFNERKNSKDEVILDEIGFNHLVQRIQKDATEDLLKACKKVISSGYGCAPSVGYMDELKKLCEDAINNSIIE